MAATYYAILTAIGEAKLANAAALGKTLQIAKMAVGDGGGATPQPNRDQKKLVNEVRRAPLNQLFIDPANPNQIIAEQVLPEDVGGWWVREMGLIDADGDLVAVCNAPDTYKPLLSSGSGRTQIIRMVLIVSNTAAVELRVDPSVVLAPRSYVDQSMVAHAKDADPHPQYAKDADLQAHVDAVDPHPQYFTAAEVETVLKAAMARVANPAGLTHLLSPTADGGWRDVYRAGWLPAWMNQQWGGGYVGTELVDGATGKLLRFDMALGNVQDDASHAIQSDAVCGEFAQPVVLPESGAYDRVLFKLYKIGNPTSPMTVAICADQGGLPGAQIAVSQPLPCRMLTNVVAGEWYQFTFSPAVDLVAGTRYHLMLSRSTGIDANNYPTIRATNLSKYPFGMATRRNNGVFTQTGLASAATACFMIPAPKPMLGSGGFDLRLMFAPAVQANCSRLLARRADYIDARAGTILVRGQVPAGGVVYDVGAAIDHDRIQIGATAAGAARAVLYRADGSMVSLTGAAPLTAGDHDVAVVYRCVGDGADYLRLLVDGVEAAAQTALTITLSDGWRDRAMSYLGGGWPLAPTWDASSLTSFAGLPSAAGWTWTGGAEASCMAAVSGRLYQTAAGYGSGDVGNYTKTGIGFSNARGWTVAWRNRVRYRYSNDGAAAAVTICDGTYTVSVLQHETFLRIGDQSTGWTVVQLDGRSAEVEYLLTAIGGAVYLFANNRLVFDGAGKLSAASGANSVSFGDYNASSGENADVVWASMRIYTGGALMPMAGAVAVNELASWSGDRSALLGQIAGSGSPVSLRTLCGISRGYLNERDAGVLRSIQRGVINGGTTASTVFVPLPDMDLFTIGAELDIELTVVVGNAAAATNTYTYPFVDGEALLDAGGNYVTPQVGGSIGNVTATTSRTSYLGLHRVDGRWRAGGSTSNFGGVQRTLRVTARS